MKISIVVPQRNNLKYFKWAYEAIRKNQGKHDVWICAAADACTDGSVEYFEELSKADERFKFIVNEGPDRLGHTILYDRIVNELVETDIAMIYHADMYLMPGALDAIEKHMYDEAIHPDLGVVDLIPNRKTIVSLTRIEPPLHPPGPEKILQDFGTEPEVFAEVKALEYAAELKRIAQANNRLTTSGIFAPWAFWVEDFNAVFGHDPLYAPQSKEDSDIFNKFALKGVEFIQTWEGFVYHMTCRGSRFNPNLTKVGQNSDEWNQQNIRSSRNFIRKWGHFVKHDENLQPIVPNKYDIGIIITNARIDVINGLEPWCNDLYISNKADNPKMIAEYINREQPNTLYDLKKRVHFVKKDDVEGLFENAKNDVVVMIDAKQMNKDYGNIITNLSEILADSGEIGEMSFNLMRFNIKKLEDYKYLLLEEQNNIKGVR